MLKCKRIRTIIPIESRTQINDCLKNADGQNIIKPFLN